MPDRTSKASPAASNTATPGKDTRDKKLPAAPRPRRSAPMQHGGSLEQVAIARELFWHNVMREMLTSLSILSAGGGDQGEGDDNILDGRLAVITQLGQRIPIASVYPLFACGMNTGDARERNLAEAVECTVFQIETPAGEVFTLPLHEIRTFHSLTEQLMERLQQSAAAQSQSGQDGEPFGFAAYTSLARRARETPDPYYPAPEAPRDPNPDGDSGIEEIETPVITGPEVPRDPG